MESFATIVNAFVNPGNSAILPLATVQHEQSGTGKNCNRRRMQNEKIATSKNGTWNSAIHKKSATRKIFFALASIFLTN